MSGDDDGGIRDKSSVKQVSFKIKFDVAQVCSDDDGGGIGDKSSVRQGAKVSLCVCVRFKRADVSRLVAKWSNSTGLTI